MASISVQFDEIDFDLLRKQKQMLLGFSTTYSAEIDGLVNLIDSIQDCTVETGQATEEEVFGPRHADGTLDEVAEAKIQAANKLV